MQNTTSAVFGFKQLIQFLRIALGSKFKQLLGWIGVMSLVYLFWITPPIIMGAVVSELARDSSADLEKVGMFAAILSLGLILEALLRMKAKPALAALSFEAAYRVKTIAFQSYLYMRLSEQEKEMSGNTIERIKDGGARVSSLLDLLNSSLLGTTLTFISVLTTMVIIDWHYALCGLVYVVVFWSIQRYHIKNETKLFLSAKRASENTSGAYAESGGNMLTIKALNLEASIRDRLQKHEEALRDLLVEQKRVAFRKYGYFRIFDGLCQGIFIMYVGSDVAQGQITVGEFTTVMAYFRSLDGAIRELVSFWDSLVENWVAVGRVSPLIIGIKTSSLGSKTISVNWSCIRLIDATVVFPNGKVALSDINLTISRGERIGVVGGSGSGKSTLAKVLLGLIPLSKGRYLIDDIAVDELNHEQIARYISIVLQDSEIFNTSLKENISGFEEIPSDVVTDSARIAELLTAIDKLPEGFATRLGEKGYRLSGGERQRVALARAICQDSDILILDEATSSLDTFTETQIHRNIANSLAGKTIVVIAHRLSTVRDVDRIIVLNQGQIVESGAPDQLLADKQSYFSTLWNYQMSQTES